MKKLVEDAGAAFDRTVQKTEEKLGSAEKTELDAELSKLLSEAEATKTWTQKFIDKMEVVLVPNPASRLKDFFDKNRTKTSNLEKLGLDMAEAGQALGPDTPYGKALIDVGHCEQKLGQAENDFVTSTAECFVHPLQNFLDNEMKVIQKAKNNLEKRRLDLDSCKTKINKAKNSKEKDLEETEKKLTEAQAEFDRQTDETRKLLDGLTAAHAAHLRCLAEFVETQARYHSHCAKTLDDLQKQIPKST